jgi:outer membrane protein OmpA-like peptidoglycan-associated protein
MAFSVNSAFAKGGDGKKEKKERTYYFTSKLSKNWFINIDGSINWWGGSDKLNFNNEFGNNSLIFNAKDFAWGGGLSFGKWITHNLAIRLAYDVNGAKTWLPGSVDKAYGNDFMFNGLSEDDFYYPTAADDVAEDFQGDFNEGRGYAKVKFLHHNIHADVMINLAEVFGADFKPDRVYTPILFAGGGVGYVSPMVTKDNWYDVVGAKGKKNWELTLDAGFMNVFRLSKSVDLHFDVKYMITRWSADSWEDEYHVFFDSHSDGFDAYRSRRLDQNLGVNVGLTWTIGGKQFESAIACDYTPYEDRIKELEKDLEDCNKNLDECNKNAENCNKNLNDCNNALEDCNKKLVDTDGDGIPDLWDACPEERGKIENGGCPVREKVSANFDQMINYETNKSDLKPSTYPHLDKLVTILNENPTYWVTIDGHTDNAGSDEINDPLSQARVDNVKGYLIEKGIDPSRIIARGHGSHEPLVPNTSKANMAKNRRTEVRLAHE